VFVAEGLDGPLGPPQHHHYVIRTNPLQMGCPPFDLLAFSEEQDRLQSLLEKENGVDEESDNFDFSLIVFVL
jgi:hypothetical protein